MKALKERKWLDEDISLLKKSPKKYYMEIFNEIVEEIKHNQSYLKEDELILC
ncbi:MAG: hypothetical protein HWN80_13195 [Candidatus Lokiarchaeota archaeon]|nr:hypothetical protein [Candidatus Lokiarchaeota archaeon]